MMIEMRPLLGASFGAEVLGGDILSERFFQRIERELIAAGVLLFRGVSLTSPQQLELMKRFGALASVAHKPANSGRHPAMMERSSLGNGDRGAMRIHSDQAYLPRPCVVSSLYCVQAAKRGGATFFADTRAACDFLPRGIKAELKGHLALNCCGEDFCGNKTAHQSLHPIFRTHPVTRRKAIYVSRAMTKKIAGLPKGKSERMLGALFAFQEQARFIYIHVWSRQDLLLFDNRSVIHGRSGFDPREKRIVRLVMAGSERPL